MKTTVRNIPFSRLESSWSSLFSVPWLANAFAYTASVAFYSATMPGGPPKYDHRSRHRLDQGHTLTVTERADDGTSCASCLIMARDSS